MCNGYSLTTLLGRKPITKQHVAHENHGLNRFFNGVKQLNLSKPKPYHTF